MRQLIAVGLGGMLGSVMRYLFSGWFQTLSKSETFPVGTIGVNILGCFVIGILGGYSETLEALSPELRAFLMIGLLGGFTTFSTFEYETLHLLRNSQFLYASLNVVIQLFIGLMAVWAGYFLSTQTR
jgi:fluoride exporter